MPSKKNRINQSVINRRKDIEYIVKTAKKYNFYYGEIMSLLMMASHSCDIECPRVDGKRVGFTINMYSPRGVLCPKFVFIQPKYRRKGIMSKLMEKWQQKEFAISIDTEEECMQNFCKKWGFTCNGKCKNGVEDWWVWSKDPEHDWQIDFSGGLVRND